MHQIRILQGDVFFEIKDFARLKISLYDYKEIINLLYFDGPLRNFYYKNISFFRCQDQKECLLQLKTKIENDTTLNEMQRNVLYIFYTSILASYSSFNYSIDTLWIGKTNNSFLETLDVVRKFNKSNNILSVEDKEFVRHLSIGSFACIILTDEEVIDNSCIEWILPLLRNGGRCLCMGKKNKEMLKSDFERISEKANITSYVLDDEFYISEICPFDYFNGMDHIVEKKSVYVELIKKFTNIQKYIEMLLNDINMLNSDSAGFDMTCQLLKEIAEDLNIEYYLFNSKDLKYEVLDLENALLDLKFQKELYGDDIDYFINELDIRYDSVNKIISKNLYDV